MLLSKSKYLLGLQCPKLLWYVFNRPDLVPEPDESTQAVFDQGHEVGDWAKKLFPGGVEVPFGDFKTTIEKTQELLGDRPVFEASFLVDDLYCRVDVLVPSGDGYDIVEVKSGGRVKEENIEDVAFQKYVLEKAGLQVKNTFLMHINSQYVRSGEIDPAQLFVKEDITEFVNNIVGIDVRVADMKRVISGDMPDVDIGPHCNSPHECPMKFDCWKLPEDNVTTLYRNAGFEYTAEGWDRIIDVPAGRLNAKQRIQQEVVKTGERHIDVPKLRKWLESVEYPIWMLDFETSSAAIPFFDGTKPYQQIPFQFSVHKVSENGSVEHFEFLWKELSDPRPSLIEALKCIESTGSVMAYYMPFEKGRIRELAQAFPDDEAFLLDLNDRMVDLIVPFNSFWVYDKKQQGSCSIKKVLPAFTDTSYDSLTIADGATAAREWLRAVKEKDNQAFEDLLTYCKQDTQAMVDLFDVIKKI